MTTFSRMARLKRVYLSGHVKETEYRKYAQEKYGKSYCLINPIEIHNGDQRFFPDDFIVEDDKTLIDLCDYMVVYINKPTFGTLMEIMYAFIKGKPVIVVNPSGEYFDDIWLKYHATEMFQTIDDAFTYIVHLSISAK